MTTMPKAWIAAWRKQWQPNSTRWSTSWRVLYNTRQLVDHLVEFGCHCFLHAAIQAFGIVVIVGDHFLRKQ